MISTITILNSSCSGLGKSVTLVGYSSVFPEISEARRFKSESNHPSQQSDDPLLSPAFQILLGFLTNTWLVHLLFVIKN